MPIRAPSPLARTLVALAVAGAGAGCGGDSSSSLGQVGDPCASASACERPLVCFEGACATEAPASATCTTAGHAPAVVDGGVRTISQAAYDLCVDAIRAANPGLDAVALGVHAVGTQLDFDIPPATASFSIVSQESPGTAVDTVTIQGFDFGNAPVPTDVRVPGGALFYDDMDSWFTDASRIDELNAYAFGFAPQVGAFTLPSTSAAIDRLYTTGGAQDGAWSFTVNDYAYECVASELAPYCTAGASAAGDYDVTVVRKPGPITSTGTLDLTVTLVSQSVTRAQVLASDEFARYVASLQRIFGQSGMCLGTVTLYEMPAWAADRWWSVDVDDYGPCAELSQLFTTSPDVNAVHVFLVDDLYSASSPPGSAVVGIDGSIPGPSGASGTIVSGVAVELANQLDPTTCPSAYDPVGCAPDFLAYVTAHEAGHWLGLFHTTEAYGELWDPLEDTTPCVCSCAPPAFRDACSAGAPGGELEPADCTVEFGPMLSLAAAVVGAGCGGGDNLMFWLFQDGVSVGNTSAEQGRVMRLNPAVH